VDYSTIISRLKRHRERRSLSTAGLITITACNGSTVNITNKNTSMHWQAETNATSNYYQLILDTTNVSAGNVLAFNVSDGTQFNTTNHTVTQSEINNGGLFKSHTADTSGGTSSGEHSNKTGR